ncbi:hypothetical protein CONCODRAFT_86083 [Conidiobolus coronatus NRRL 28638]|uniref:Brl1/Brr6 domain-containing protein n=1 Tax=Conidiobolus coronatus (strain ATCC 28846 / CBS 209.66 / NRRL 28638) TaxID=796925 RepID=A0A137P265_CONC2|nr:hypothetical protein CONCODRAFT_86083 [Conidiobolus coronatus NRRL 28638]|eukprot:KXN69143.1 hypothetical protein CONCODRAFT_86083 [Conidiobolus coronatus NRRL 28638]
MKLTDDTKNPPKKSLFIQLLTNLYAIITNIIQSINFNTVLTLIATFILLSLVFHLYHDFDKLYNEHYEKKLIEREEAIDYYNIHCKSFDYKDPDIEAISKDICYQEKLKSMSNYLIVNKTKVWVELIGGLINHFFNSLSLKTLITLVGLIVLGSVLTNLSSILNIGKGRAKDDEPREVRHVLYFENYQNNQGQNSSQLRSISQDSSNFGGRAIEAGSVASSNLVPLSSY